MSAEAQTLIQEVRSHIGKEDYSGAASLLGNAPADRESWTPQEKDEVLCLEEFLQNLNSPLRAGPGSATEPHEANESVDWAKALQHWGAPIVTRDATTDSPREEAQDG